MTEQIDINEALDRLAAIEVECCQELGFDATAVPYFLYIQEVGDYWKNRVLPIAYDEPESEEMDTVVVEVAARFIVGKRTLGHPGDQEYALYKVIAAFADWVNEHEGLQSAAFTEFQTDLDYAIVTSCTGFTEFQDNPGAPDIQVGTEFTVRLSYRLVKEQQYTS